MNENTFCLIKKVAIGVSHVEAHKVFEIENFHMNIERPGSETWDCLSLEKFKTVLGQNILSCYLLFMI